VRVIDFTGYNEKGGANGLFEEFGKMPTRWELGELGNWEDKGLGFFYSKTHTKHRDCMQMMRGCKPLWENNAVTGKCLVSITVAEVHCGMLRPMDVHNDGLMNALQNGALDTKKEGLLTMENKFATLENAVRNIP